MSSVQGIGVSFQLAITTPPINVIGYGTAAAQRRFSQDQPNLGGYLYIKYNHVSICVIEES